MMLQKQEQYCIRSNTLTIMNTGIPNFLFKIIAIISIPPDDASERIINPTPIPTKQPAKTTANKVS